MTSGQRLWDRSRPLLLVGGVILLIGASLGVAVYDEARRRDEDQAMAGVQARVLAHTVTAALSFGDRAALGEYVEALRAGPEIEAVAIYDNAGQPVASFDRTERVGEPWRDPGRELGRRRIVAVAPVDQRGVGLGRVYVRHRAEPLGQRMRRYAPAAILGLMGSLMFAVISLDAQRLRRAYRALQDQIVQREKAEAALRQSQKMEAIGRLTGGIAHDFNNMLAIVMGSLDLLLRRYANADPKLLRFAQEARAGAARAAVLTQRLLAFSRLQPLKPVSADVAKTITDMAGILRRTLGETITVDTVAADGLWRAYIDRAELETALLNLAINARDAMPDGGVLTIATSNAQLDRPPPGADTDPEFAPGPYVMIAISDTGSGIPAEVLSQVFEPFFTTKPTGKGTGLGLSQVLGFIKQSGGHVRIDSEVGTGTRVQLFLPRSSAPEEPAPLPPPALSRVPANITILVVEDEPGVRAFATEALVELGYQVISADRGESAVDLLTARDDVVLLLTDVIMPGMNGQALAARARELRPGLKVVFMSGYDRNVIAQNGTLAPDAHLLAKPFTIAQLGAALELALEAARAHSEA
jgi:signal transduction histidine kinase/CheY-like chemotaxis protein